MCACVLNARWNTTLNFDKSGGGLLAVHVIEINFSTSTDKIDKINKYNVKGMLLVLEN